MPHHVYQCYGVSRDRESEKTASHNSYQLGQASWVLGYLMPIYPNRLVQVGELDELQTFVGSKKTLRWLWTAVEHLSPGILGWAIVDRSSQTDEAIVAGN